MSKSGLSRRTPKRKRHSHVVMFVGLAVSAIFVWFICASLFARSIRIDLRQNEVAARFIPSPSARISHDSRGIRLACQEPSYLLAPEYESTWEQYPYLKLKLAESDAPSALVFWLRKNSKVTNGVRRLEPGSSGGTFILSAKTSHYWTQQMPWQGPINKIGILVPSGTIVVSEIVLTDSLTPWEWIRFSASELRSVEPLTAYSINIIWGASINGWNLTTVCGCLAIIVLLIAVFARSPRTGRLMIGLAAGLILVVDTSFLATLIRTNGESSSRSALKTGQEDEYISRFGTEYAAIARTLRREAPIGSSVFVPERKRADVPAESDWIYFQLWPQYRQAPDIGQADYFVLLHPNEARYDSQNETLVIPNEDPIRADPLLILNPEAMLLKRKQ